MTTDEMKARRNELIEIIKMRQAELAAEMRLTDDSTDAAWDVLNDRLSAMPEYAERTALTVSIESAEAREIQASIAARKRIHLQMCPKHHIALTMGRCDECDDWDN